MSPVAEILQLAPCPAICALDESLFQRAGLHSVSVVPLLHLDAARSVVQLVCDVGCLSCDVAYLADDGDLTSLVPYVSRKSDLNYLRGFSPVDLEIVVCIRLRVADLLNGNRTE